MTRFTGQAAQVSGRPLVSRSLPDPVLPTPVAHPLVRQLGPPLLYLGAAFWFMSVAWVAPRTRLAGTGNDPYLFVFFLRWLPWALAHGHNPAFTDYIRYPHGANLMWNTWIPLPALLTAPITLWLGPVFDYNLILLLSFALSGWVAYFAIRRFTTRWSVAVLGGLLYEMTPYMVGHALGNPNLTLAVLPPICVILLDDLLRTRTRSPRRVGVYLGLAVAAQVLITNEVFAGTVVAAVVTVVWLLLLRRRRAPVEWGRHAAAIGWAAVTTLPLVAVPLAYQLLGPDRIAGRLFPTERFVTDPAGLLIPNGHLFAAPRFLAAVSDTLPGNQVENSMYILPLALLALVAFVFYRREIHVRVAAAVAVTMTVLSFGPHLHWEGSATRIPLPGWVLWHAPLLENMLPVRLMLFTYLALILLTCVLLDRLSQQGGARASLVISALLVLAFLPHRLVWEGAKSPAFFTTSAVRAVPQGALVVVAPVARDGYGAQSMLWQQASGFRFRTLGGYVWTPYGARMSRTLADELSPTDRPVLIALIDAETTGLSHVDPVRARSIREDLQAMHIRAVVVGPMPHESEAVTLMEAVLQARPDHVGQVYVWHLR